MAYHGVLLLAAPSYTVLSFDLVKIITVILIIMLILKLHLVQAKPGSNCFTCTHSFYFYNNFIIKGR